jgi:glycosyltransferase involved in cell wall biosynthesis
VLLPAYNAVATIGRALESIRWQTRPPDQIVVVDDGSTDGTAEVLEQYAPGMRIRVVAHPHRRGLVAALQSGAAAIETTWVARLDADDIWLPLHLSTLMSSVAAEHSLIASRALVVRGSVTTPSSGPYDHLAVKFALCWDNPFVHTASAFSLQHYTAVGGYKPGRFEDYDLWSRLSCAGAAVILGSVTTVHVKRTGSLSDIDRRESLRSRFVMQAEHWRRLPLPTRAAALPLLVPNFLRVRL